MSRNVPLRYIAFVLREPEVRWYYLQSPLQNKDSRKVSASLCFSEMALFFFFFATVFLLFPATQSQSCGPIDFDISTLKSAAFWWLEVDPFYCASGKLQSLDHYSNSLQEDIKNATNVTQPCMIIFSVCKTLPILCPNQGVCKVKGMSSDFQYISWPVSLGSMEYDGFKFDTGDKFLSIEYHNGDKMSCKSTKGDQLPLKTRITFNCDKNAKWNTTAKKGMPFAGGAKAPPGNIIFNHVDCMYKLTFNSSEGCPDYGPGGTKGHPLSTGSILLILFFPSVFLYCIIGGMINAGRHKSGTDLIPNYSFWKDLPYLVLDGFGFVVACITCSKISTTTPKPNSYQSM